MLDIDRRGGKIMQNHAMWNLQDELSRGVENDLLQPGQMRLDLDNQGFLTTFAVLCMLAKRMGGESLLFCSKPLTPF